MAITTSFDFTSIQDRLTEQIKDKQDQIEFFIEKIIIDDERQGEYKPLIEQIDTQIMTIIDDANDKLEAVKTAYQNRIDGGSRTDLFWRQVSSTPPKYMEAATSSRGGGGSSYRVLTSPGTRTYECTRLSERGYGHLSGVTTESPVPNSEGKYPIPSFRNLFNKGGGSLGVYNYTQYLTEEEFNKQYPKGSVKRENYFAGYPYGIQMLLSQEDYNLYPNETYFPSISTTPANKARYYPHNTLIGFESDNYHGIKCFDEPRTKDIADTTVTTFMGYISAGSTNLVVLSPYNSGLLYDVKPNQLVVTDDPKQNIFPLEYSEIVGIGQTIGNLNYLNNLTPCEAYALVDATTSVSKVQIFNEGFGYDFVPKVTVNPPSGRQATAEAVISNSGKIQSVKILDKGSGYVSVPSVDVSWISSQAFASANVSSAGTISSVDVTISGLGYDSAPSVNISIPGVNAIGIATVNSSGIITAINIVQNGIGYTNTATKYPVIAIDSPTGAGTTATAVAVVNSAGIITSVTITNGGSGYSQSFPPGVSISDPNWGKTARLTSQITDGKVVSIKVLDGGSQYNAAYPPVIAISSPSGTTNSVLEAVLEGNGSVNSIKVINPGSGYTSSSPPTIYIDPPFNVTANDATFVASVNAGVVTNISITNPGYGYSASSTIPLSIELPYDDVLNVLTLDSAAKTSVASTSPITFKVLISANTLTGLITDYSIGFNLSPYSPQTISMMKSSNIGIGTYITYDNSGNPSETHSWKPELKADAVGDPNSTYYVPAVSEPIVGAGKIWYKLGFKYAPYKPKSGVDLSSYMSNYYGRNIGLNFGWSKQTEFTKDDFEPAQEGDRMTISDQVDVSYVLRKLSDVQSLENAVQKAIDEANKSEQEMKASSGILNQLIVSTNTVREMRDDVNVEMWGKRTLIGALQSEIETLKGRLNTIGYGTT